MRYDDWTADEFEDMLAQEDELIRQLDDEQQDEQEAFVEVTLEQTEVLERRIGRALTLREQRWIGEEVGMQFRWGREIDAEKALRDAYQRHEQREPLDLSNREDANRFMVERVEDMQREATREAEADEPEAGDDDQSPDWHGMKRHERDEAMAARVRGDKTLADVANEHPPREHEPTWLSAEQVAHRLAEEASTDQEET